MKKAIVLVFSICTLSAFSQSSIQLTNITGATVNVTANSDIYTSTQTYEKESLEFDITNISAATNSYVVKRYDMLLNISAPDTAVAHFCFAGYCFLPDTRISPQVQLLKNQSTSGLTGENFVLQADLDEQAVPGKSIVRYTIMNVSNPADSLQFTIKYNYQTGVKELNKNLSSLAMFPNPAGERVFVAIQSPQARETTLTLYNSLGMSVLQRSLNLSEGKNQFEIDLHNLPSGVYFTTVKTGTATLTKRLVIN